MTFRECEEIINSARNSYKKLKNNTYLHMLDDNTYGIKLHNTFILTINRNETYKLNTGGWETVTTKQRLNQYLPRNIRVYSDKGIWQCFITFFNEKVQCDYEDNMIITCEGDVL